MPASSAKKVFLIKLVIRGTYYIAMPFFQVVENKDGNLEENVLHFFCGQVPIIPQNSFLYLVPGLPSALF